MVWTALYLGNSEGNSKPRRMRSRSFSAVCSLSFIVTAEDEGSMIIREASHSLTLVSSSSRWCEPAERASFMTRTARVSCGR